MNKRFGGRPWRVLSYVMLCLLPAGTAHAQSDRGTITGTVTDSSGAVVPGASIVAENPGTRPGVISLPAAPPRPLRRC